eukprot:6207682-Pleurochrysis_carterae.AAC.2
MMPSSTTVKAGEGRLMFVRPINVCYIEVPKGTRLSVLSMWMTGYRAQHWLNDTKALSEFVVVLRCYWNNKDIEAAHSLLLYATEMLHPQRSYTMDCSSSRLRKDVENFFTIVKSSLDHLWAHYVLKTIVSSIR